MSVYLYALVLKFLCSMLSPPPVTIMNVLFPALLLAATSPGIAAVAAATAAL